jgi:hypothetical protein
VRLEGKLSTTKDLHSLNENYVSINYKKREFLRFLSLRKFMSEKASVRFKLKRRCEKTRKGMKGKIINNMTMK